jgi:hypothetical protein
MQAFQERVVVEKSDLDKKLESLKSFLLSETYRELSDDEQKLLRQQISVMDLYSDILEKRILMFPND